jgi:galactosamine-6-phosphate isomerase
MRITLCEDYTEMSTRAADLVRQELKKKPGLLLCAATGASPEGLYRELGTSHRTEPGLYEKLRIIKLDEWGGVPENHPVTCEQYIRDRLIGPLDIKEERYLTYRSDPEDPEGECGLIRSHLAREGPIDLCILGLGQNGHLGLNEPASQLEPFCHVARLSERSLEHNMIASMDMKPRYGLTLGMQEILSSRRILLLVTGAGKKGIVNRLMEQKISTTLPASLLWTHVQVDCFLDRSAQL